MKISLFFMLSVLTAKALTEIKKRIVIKILIIKLGTGVECLY